MKNTIPPPLGTYKNPTEFKLPSEYIFWNVFWSEETMCEDALTYLQARLLHSILSSWNIQAFAVLEIERLQTIKLTRKPVFNRDLQTIPLKDIVGESSSKIILDNLENIGAKSCVFERYAWKQGKQRNRSQLNSFLSTQTCSL